MYLKEGSLAILQSFFKELYYFFSSIHMIRVDGCFSSKVVFQ